MNKDDVVAQGTPRTDAIERKLEAEAFANTSLSDTDVWQFCYGGTLELARELEREVAALSAQRSRDKVTHDLDLQGKMLEAAKAQIIKLSAQVVELQKENAELANYKFMYESCSK